MAAYNSLLGPKSDAHRIDEYEPGDDGREGAHGVGHEVADADQRARKVGAHVYVDHLKQ